MTCDPYTISEWDLTCHINGKDWATQSPNPDDDLAALQLYKSPDAMKLSTLGKSLLTPDCAAHDPQFSIEQWGMLIVAVYTYRKMMLARSAGMMEVE